MNASPTSTFRTSGLTERARLSHRAAFISIAIIFVIFTAASAVPSPLYVVYQAEWGFSSTALTFVFAIYVVGLLGSLLVFGALSDHIGRRPVLGAAVALQTVALVFFITAGNIELLAVARFLQGVATGAAFTTLGAALVDLNPPHAPKRAGMVSSIAPPGGLALGAVGCGALVQYGPAPTQLVFAILMAGMVFAAAIVAVMPETSSLRPGGRNSLKPRVGIPAGIRKQVYALVPIMAASWALAGLYLSLGPSIAASVFGMTSHVIGGLVVTLLCGTGAITAFRLRNWTTDRLLNFAAIGLLAGILVTLAGLAFESVLLAALGTAIAGIGFGASSLGTFGTYALIATPDERGELFAVAFVISYVCFSIPAVIAGYASSTSFGLQASSIVYGVAVAILAAVAIVAQRRTPIGTTAATEPDAA